MMKKGISLVSLIITMVIMITLLTSVTVGGVKTVNNNKKITFATEINMIQSAIDTYKTRNNGAYPTSGMISLDLSNVTDKSKEQFLGENISSNIIVLNKINYSQLGITTLKYGNLENGDTDIYAFSETTGRVYYAKGLSIASNTYYTLTDDLKKIIEYTSENNAYDGITFTVSETEWTLNSVVTTVKVPKSYTNCTVGVTGQSSNYTSSLDGDYNVYVIDNIDSNYVIKVDYTKNGKECHAEYTIDNVDNTPPVISNDNVKLNVAESQDKLDVFLSLEDCYDTLSGINTIKYAYSYIEEENIANYFKNNGFRAYNGVVEIEKANKYFTLYVEDKVGNYSAMYYELPDETYQKMAAKQVEDAIQLKNLITAEMIKNDTTSNADGTFNKYVGQTVTYTGYDEEAVNQPITWKIYGVDRKTNKILLVADKYLDLTYKELPLNFRKDTYRLTTKDTVNRETFCNFLADKDNWTELAIPGKTSAYGSPRADQLIDSYALRHTDKYIIGTEFATQEEVNASSIGFVNAIGWIFRFSSGTEAETTDSYQINIGTQDSLYVKETVTINSINFTSYALASYSTSIHTLILIVQNTGLIVPTASYNGGCILPIISLDNINLYESGGNYFVE